MSQLEKLEQLAISLHCDVRNQEPMRKHTTFKIGRTGRFVYCSK